MMKTTEDLWRDANTEMTSSPHQIERQTSVYDMDIKCHICYELLVKPTSLACGHTFCRLCLVQWYNTSKRLECPDCRSPWQEVPKVNIFIREVLQKDYPEKLKEREEALNTGENDKIIADFEKFGQQLKAKGPVAGLQGRPVQPPRQNAIKAKDFCVGFLVAAGVVMMMYVGWYWRYSNDGLLIYKPILRWEPEDVGTWLEELGAWSADYASNAIEERIDGRQLLVMDETDLSEKLDIMDNLHRKVVLQSLKELTERGSKLPGTLWEYKSLHPGLAILLLYGMKDNPRTTMLLMYMFEYDSVFIPFVHNTCAADSEAGLDMFDNITSRQLTEFVSCGIFLPYYLIGIYAYDWMTTHYWISRLIILTCMSQTYLECTFIVNFLRGEYRNIAMSGKNYGKSLLSGVFFVIIWPVIPSFICNIFFYVALYLSPYVSLEKTYHHIRSNNPRN
ncbi:bifunctional apoptosis regulator-like [Ylistrum balloti]|uniref:bifunctional apoptosis regulator-like n=1 Tax=Ylistrum balloti TaxID=509963 RepID=UPI00290580F8|nr:bifunctional apoptosis regulator-like [Ylistrum balloti]